MNAPRSTPHCHNHDTLLTRTDQLLKTQPWPRCHYSRKYNITSQSSAKQRPSLALASSSLVRTRHTRAIPEPLSTTPDTLTRAIETIHIHLGISPVSPSRQSNKLSDCPASSTLGAASLLFPLVSLFCPDRLLLYPHDPFTLFSHICFKIPPIWLLV